MGDEYETLALNFLEAARRAPAPQQAVFSDLVSHFGPLACWPTRVK
jgi:hypothetical protein